MKQYFAQRPLFIILVVIAVTVIIFTLNVFQTRNLKIVFLDVGQGDATLIITPHGRQILIDAGASSSSIGGSLARYMNASDRSLDMVIMTHPDLDHVGGVLSLIDDYRIDRLMHSGLLAGSSVYEAIALRSVKKNIPIFTAHVGQRIILDAGVYLDIYSPYAGFESAQANDHSIVMKLIYGNNSVLITGDASKYIEHDMVQSFAGSLQSDILKIGHHGSQTSSSDEFIETVAPEYGVISAGCNNRYGHPHADVLARLFRYELEVLDTCREGDVVFEGDGVLWTRI